MNNELFTHGDTPFNLSGEALDNSTTQEGEARVRAIAEREARKAQRALDFDEGEFCENAAEELGEGPDLSHDSDCTYRFGHAAECSCNKDSRALFAQILKPFQPEA